MVIWIKISYFDPTMKTILILGAGRSSTVLIDYLLKEAATHSWKVIVADVSKELAESKVKSHSNGSAIAFDLNNETQRNELINNASVVVSLLPPSMHYLVALTCFRFSVSLFTASYVSKEIADLHDEAVKKNMLILMECGLDPGIDHMSAVKEMELIKEKKGLLRSFKSYTGGLIAPESDDNPWHYKITWNPRNVVTAGKGISKFMDNGKIVEVGYQDVFSQTEKISVKGFGEFEGYPNRDSLSYLKTYQLSDLKTFIRGTLRRPGYCSAWNILVKMGYTNDETLIVKKGMSFLDLASELTGGRKKEDILIQLKSLGANTNEIEKIEWLGCLSDNLIGLENATPADALQLLLERNWKLKKDDKDMIVMQHQFEYEMEGRMKKLTSSLVVTGENEHETAMAKTVGLPLAISVKLFLEGKISLKGVQVPIHQEIYLPVLHELESGFSIRFRNEETIL